MAEPRPTSAGRGYGWTWRKRALAHLDRVRLEQEGEGWPGGPWCECEECRAYMDGYVRRYLENGSVGRAAGAAMLARAMELLGQGVLVPPKHFLRADTVDHYPRKRRLFPIHLQGSDAPGGSDHPSNLRAMAHSHHSRRADDKARRRG